MRLDDGRGSEGADVPPRGVVVFDAVRTLLHAHPPVVEVYAAAAARHGSRLSAEEVARRWHRLIPGLLSTPILEVTEHGELERWRRVVAAVVDDAGDQRALFQDLWAHFGKPQSWRIDGQFPAVRARLEADGWRLAVASNFDARLHAICRGLPEMRGISVFCATDIGQRKPATAFYRGVAERLSMPPERLWMIGDDLDDDVLAARRAGWNSAWLADDADHASVDASVPLLRCLDDLTQVLPVDGRPKKRG